MRRLCPLDLQVLYALHTRQIPCHPYTSLIRINCLPIVADQPQRGASARQRSSASRSRTLRLVLPCSTTTAMAPARLCHRASTQTQASHQTRQQAALSTQPTARLILPQHQAQAAPGATATTSPEKCHKKRTLTRSALSHKPIPSASLHASTSLHQQPPRHLA